MDDPIVALKENSSNQADNRSGMPSGTGKKTGKPRWILVAGLFLLLAAGAAAFYAYSYFLMSPQTVLVKMMQKAAGTQTAEFDGEIKAKVKLFFGEDLAVADDVAREKIDLDIDFSGGADLTNPYEPKISLNSVISGEEFMERNIYFESVAIARTAYAKLSGSSTLLRDEKVTPFLNQWVRLDLGKFAGEISEKYPDLAKYLEKAILKTPLTPDQIIEMRAALANKEIFTFKEDLGEGFVNDIACYHYEVEINKDALRDYLRAAGAITQDQVSQQYVGQLIDMVGETEISGGEVWISKKDFSLRRIKAEADYRDSYSGMVSYSANLSGNINYSEIDGPVAIVTPEEYREFADIFKQSKAFIEAEGRDAQRRSDMRQIVLAQTKYFEVYGRYYSFDAVDGGCENSTGACFRFVPDYIEKMPADPLSDGLICGKNYFYCNHNNAQNNKKFCYYAKLEGGGYYTASPSGNFERKSPPTSFLECAQTDLK